MAAMILNGRYHIIRALKGSSPGRTFLVEDIQSSNGRYYVLKQLQLPRNDPQSDHWVRQLFYERVEVLSKLADESDQIPTIFDYFEEGGRFYLVREWVEGATLTFWMQKKGLPEQDEVEEILLNLLEDLSDLHFMQICHGNIKPSNIILRQRDELPILADFNLLPIGIEVPVAAPVGDAYSPNQPMTPYLSAFSSPEQMAGQLCCASDLYSLGLTAIFLLTGRSPQQLNLEPQTGKILWRHFVPKIDSDLADIIDIAIQPRAEDRYATATEMLEDFQDIIPPELLESDHSFSGGRNKLSLLMRGITIALLAAFLMFGYTTLKRVFGSLSEPTVTASATPPVQASSSVLPGETTTRSAASPSPTVSAPSAVRPLTQAQATELISQWLASKQRLFSPPYDRTTADALTTDPLLTDITKPGGSIDWLQQNNARYEFRTSQIASVSNFQVANDRAVIDVTVIEDRTLYINNRIDVSKTGSGTSVIRYQLRAVDGQWKIADYQDVR